MRQQARDPDDTDLSAPEPAAQLERRVRALDAWNSYRLDREHHLIGKQLSRDAQMLARFELVSLEQTHAAVLDHVRRVTTLSLEPSPTVVIAHRSQWFAARVRQSLEGEGLIVVECTHNGAEALGAVIAEQPDYVLVSDRLVMMPAERLLAETSRYSPHTEHVVHAEEGAAAPFRNAGCLVLGPRHSPSEVTEALLEQRAAAPRARSRDLA